ncbi:NAD-dependent epimerase/dehydratase family protein [Erythrobacter sp. MTPC3]|uniref:NAD-dependent epimerase/dehydratase family protein n=1 Tax=Erythrobacter sp. MTPC3 TaxID=3056564 RepID=UPI0036F391A6
MRIALTGATGTIGAAFADAAKAAGHDLTLFARNIPEGKRGLGDWHTLDLADEADGDTTAQALRGADVAVHLAARIDTAAPSDDAARALFEANVLGSGRFIRALAKAGVPRMVMASSANIYDPSLTVADECSAIRPVSRTLYLSSKIAQESYARELCSGPGISCAIMRISSVIGTGSDLVSRFAANVVNGERITLANPDYGSDCVALGDVVSGLLLAAQGDFAGEYNLSSGVRHTLSEIVAIAAECAGKDAVVDRTAAGEHADRGFPAIDCSRLRAKGYSPQPLADVIGAIVAAHGNAASSGKCGVSA